MAPLSAERRIPRKFNYRYYDNDPWRVAHEKGEIEYDLRAPLQELISLDNGSTISFQSSGHVRYPVKLDVIDGPNNLNSRFSGLRDLGPSSILDDFVFSNIETKTGYYGAFNIQLGSRINEIQNQLLVIENIALGAEIEINPWHLHDNDIDQHTASVVGALMITPGKTGAFEKIRKNGLLIYSQNRRFDPIMALPGHLILKILPISSEDQRRMSVDRSEELSLVDWARWSKHLVAPLMYKELKPFVVESRG